MKPENLSDAMQFLDDSTLTETAHVLKKRPLNPRRFAPAAAAACICIAVLLAVPTLTGQLPSAAPGSGSMSNVHGDSTLQGESTPSPASGTDSANTPRHRGHAAPHTRPGQRRPHARGSRPGLYRVCFERRDPRARRGRSLPAHHHAGCKLFCKRRHGL